MVSTLGPTTTMSEVTTGVLFTVVVNAEIVVYKVFTLVGTYVYCRFGSSTTMTLVV